MKKKTSGSDTGEILLLARLARSPDVQGRLLLNAHVEVLKVSEVDLRKNRDGSSETVPPAIERFQRYAGVPGACPHPVVVLEVIPDHVMKAFQETMNAPNAIAKEERRRTYMAILANEVMNQNPIALKKKGPDARMSHD